MLSATPSSRRGWTPPAAPSSSAAPRRAQAKRRCAEPLAKAVIVATEEERAVIERFADLVEAELQALEFVSEEGERGR